MIHIIKVKVPGKPVKTWTSTSLKKERPEIFELYRDMKPGDKKKFNRGTPKNPRWVGIHYLHPSEMSEKARRKVCSPGLRGEARRKFIEEGMTLQEQMMQGRIAAAAATTASVERWKAAHPEEYAHRTKARKERAAKKRKETGRIDYSKYYNPKHLAKAAGLTPAEIRKFLRKKKIGKRGGRYAFTRKEAVRIAKAAKRYYAELEE